MPYEIIVFLVGLSIIAFLNFGRGALSGFTIPKIGTLGTNAWWSGKNADQKLWSLYIALAVITIFVAYLIPDGPDGNGSYRYKIMGAIVLIGLHLVIWPFFTDKTSAVTKFLVSAFLIFCVVAFLFPNVADKTWKSVKNQATDFDNNYGKPPVVTSQAAVTAVAVTSVPLTIPVDETIVIAPPNGYRLSSALCPPENVMEITSGREGQIPRQIDCAGKIVLQEAELYGKGFAFFQKPGGTQSSTVIVRWVKIS